MKIELCLAVSSSFCGVFRQKNAIKVAAEQQIAMYKAQIEQAIKQQELSLDHQWQQQQVELQQVLLSLIVTVSFKVYYT